MTESENAAGVQQLIDRLSQEGVAKGQRQAADIVKDAEKKADQILEAAREDANAILAQARKDADQFQQAGEEALRLAARDAVRDFGARIHEGLRSRLQELVQHQLKQPSVIGSMILEIARQATAEVGEEALELLIPPEVVTEDEARRRIEEGEPDALMDFIRGLIGEDLRDGFTVHLGNQDQSGLTVRVTDENVEIDLTDRAITELLAQHLLPRFRAVMRST